MGMVLAAWEASYQLLPMSLDYFKVSTADYYVRFNHVSAHIREAT